MSNNPYFFLSFLSQLILDILHNYYLGKRMNGGNQLLRVVDVSYKNECVPRNLIIFWFIFTGQLLAVGSRAFHDVHWLMAQTPTEIKWVSITKHLYIFTINRSKNTVIYVLIDCVHLFTWNKTRISAGLYCFFPLRFYSFGIFRSIAPRPLSMTLGWY